MVASAVQAVDEAELVDRCGKRLEAGVAHPDRCVAREESQVRSLTTEPERVTSLCELAGGNPFVLTNHVVPEDPACDLADGRAVGQTTPPLDEEPAQREPRDAPVDANVPVRTGGEL